MKQYLILLALLSFTVGCNIKIEPTSNANITVSQNGNSITVSQNNPSNSANNSAKPTNAAKPAEETKKVERREDFSSHYVDLDYTKCDPIDPNVGVRSMEYRCPGYHGEGQSYYVRNEGEGNELEFQTSTSGRIWTVETMGFEKRVPLTPQKACPTSGDRIVGISWGKKLELLIYQDRVFAAIVRVKCHVEGAEREYSNDPSIQEDWKVTKEMLIVRGIGEMNNIGGFDIDAKTPNANEVARKRAEDTFLEVLE